MSDDYVVVSNIRILFLYLNYFINLAAVTIQTDPFINLFKQ